MDFYSGCNSEQRLLGTAGRYRMYITCLILLHSWNLWHYCTWCVTLCNFVDQLFRCFFCKHSTFPFWPFFCSHTEYESSGHLIYNTVSTLGLPDPQTQYWVYQTLEHNIWSARPLNTTLGLPDSQTQHWVCHRLSNTTLGLPDSLTQHWVCQTLKHNFGSTRLSNTTLSLCDSNTTSGLNTTLSLLNIGST
jgi:hypothetical protein